MHELTRTIPHVLKYVARNTDFFHVNQIRAQVKNDGIERTILICTSEYDEDFLDPYPDPSTNRVDVFSIRKVFELEYFRERLAHLLSRSRKLSVSILFDVDDQSNSLLYARFTRVNPSRTLSEEEQSSVYRTSQCLQVGDDQDHFFLGNSKTVCGFCGARIEKSEGEGGSD